MVQGRGNHLMTHSTTGDHEPMGQARRRVIACLQRLPGLSGPAQTVNPSHSVCNHGVCGVNIGGWCLGEKVQLAKSGKSMGQPSDTKDRKKGCQVAVEGAVKTNSQANRGKVACRLAGNKNARTNQQDNALVLGSLRTVRAAAGYTASVRAGGVVAA